MKPLFKIVMGLGAICLLAALILYLINSPKAAVFCGDQWL
jgi:hypothetical protein